MFEPSGNYDVVKLFRRENAENSAAFQSSTSGATTSQKVKTRNADSFERNKALNKSVQGVDHLHKEHRTQLKENISAHANPAGDTRRNKLYWLRVLVYYLLFYLGIALLFYICFTIYMLTLPDEAPRVSKYQVSLIYYPSLESYYVNRISWNEQNKEDINRIVKQIKYSLQTFGGHRVYGKCNESDAYGYKNRSPCIFLKVNRIAGFNVEAIEHSKELPRREYSLKKLIDNLPMDDRKGRLWISCKSEAGVNIEYFPITQSIPVEGLNFKGITYSDYQRSPNYTDERIVAIKLRNIPLDIPFKVQCKMFAKNIEISYLHGRNIGTVCFHIETKTE